jgi:hypothetical protein
MEEEDEEEVGTGWISWKANELIFNVKWKKSTFSYI